MASADEERDDSLSLTEMLLKELEVEVTRPEHFEDNDRPHQGPRTPPSPAPDDNWTHNELKSPQPPNWRKLASYLTSQSNNEGFNKLSNNESFNKSRGQLYNTLPDDHPYNKLTDEFNKSLTSSGNIPEFKRSNSIDDPAIKDHSFDDTWKLANELRPSEEKEFMDDTDVTDDDNSNKEGMRELVEDLCGEEEPSTSNIPNSRHKHSVPNVNLSQPPPFMKGSQPPPPHITSIPPPNIRTAIPPPNHRPGPHQVMPPPPFSGIGSSPGPMRGMHPNHYGGPPPMFNNTPPPRMRPMGPMPMGAGPPPPMMRVCSPMSGYMHPTMNHGPGNRPFFNAGPPNTNYRPMKISVTNLPDTTLPTQLKLKKKKKVKKVESPEEASAADQSPPKPPSPPPLPAEAPPLPDHTLPPLPPDLPPNSPSKPSALRHVKEHKLVMKVKSRTLNESTLKLKNVEAQKHFPAGDDEPEKEQKRSNQSKSNDPITSLRLGENEALPDLYSKLKKLNEELANLQEDISHSSSDSDTDDKEMKTQTSLKASEDESKGSSKINSATEKKNSIEKSNARPNLDARIKMMMAAEKGHAKNMEVESPAKPAIKATPITTYPPERPSHSNKSIPVAVPTVKFPPTEAVKDDVLKPLLRAPSPFLSKEIYRYWHKESLKFSKYRKRKSVPYVNPSEIHKFKNSVALSAPKSEVNSTELEDNDLDVYKLLDNKLLQERNSKILDSHSKALISAEIKLDLKRLEEINRELEALDDEDESEENEEMEISEDITASIFEKDESSLSEAPVSNNILNNDSNTEKESNKMDFIINDVAKEIKECNQLSGFINPERDSVKINNSGEKCASSISLKRKVPDSELINLVMNTVMEELRKDLKTSITNNLVDTKINAEYNELASKKQKV